MPPGDWDRIEAAAGTVGARYSAGLLTPAQRCLDGVIALLEGEGVGSRSGSASITWGCGSRPRSACAPEVQTASWFAVTPIGVAVASGRFPAWRLTDQAVALLVLGGIGWLMVRVGG